MASKKAHKGSGIAAGLFAAAIVVDAGAGGPYYVLALLTALAGRWGGTAPDWMEIAWWRSKRHRGAARLWIKHRTVTHWGIPWVMLLVYGYMNLGSVWWAPVAFGFAAGGVMHLLTDWPNPMGVPWVWRRHSLSMWRSGRLEPMVIVLSWAGCALGADALLAGGANTMKLWAFVSASV
jgi:membrane-bound metal-dependent hydrolase YbcI (DUF457 family)